MAYIVDIFVDNLAEIDRVVLSPALHTYRYLVKTTLFWAEGTKKYISTKIWKLQYCSIMWGSKKDHSFHYRNNGQLPDGGNNYRRGRRIAAQQWSHCWTVDYYCKQSGTTNSSSWLQRAQSVRALKVIGWLARVPIMDCRQLFSILIW